jgi:hypothetical protein
VSAPRAEDEEVEEDEETETGLVGDDDTADTEEDSDD